jgi:tetratricopeptide (TPR) repeat protein
VPTSTWDALLIHIRNPADAARLANSARNRLLYRYAIPLYHHAADAGDQYAADRLTLLLIDRGDLGELRGRADAGDTYAALELGLLLAYRGDLDEAVQILRTMADAGDGNAAERLAKLLAERDDLGELRARADAGDTYAALELARLLAYRGDLDEAVQILRRMADAGDGDAERLVELLTQQGWAEEAERLRRFGLNPDGSVARG